MKAERVLKFSMIFALLSSVYSCASVDCSSSKDDYQNGYSSGKLVKLMSGSGSCSSYVDSYNEQTGRSTLKATDCFCEGYDDGLNGNPAKH
jgi:hypothetical protein